MEDIIGYSPIIYVDKKEPFSFKKVGYKIYEENGARSKSFNRTFDFENFKGTKKVIEYAYYLDYDIQHLYDLEHIWLYVGNDGNIVGAEGSFHGRFLNAIIPEFTRFCQKNESEDIHPSGSRLIMYSQPGKHAMLCSPKFMYLYSELYESCGRLSGIHGLDTPSKYLEDIHITEEENEKVSQYIKENYSFEPSMEFEETLIQPEDYIPWDELEKQIPVFIKAQLKKILDY